MLTFCAYTAVAGHPVKKCHVVEAVGGEIFVQWGHTVGQLLANVGQVTLGRLIS